MQSVEFRPRVFTTRVAFNYLLKACWLIQRHLDLMSSVNQLCCLSHKRPLSKQVSPRIRPEAVLAVLGEYQRGFVAALCQPLRNTPQQSALDALKRPNPLERFIGELNRV